MLPTGQQLIMLLTKMHMHTCYYTFVPVLIFFMKTFSPSSLFRLTLYTQGGVSLLDNCLNKVGKKKWKGRETIATEQLL